MPVLFYPSKAHASLNGREFHPELINGHAMLNPKLPVYDLRGNAAVMCDSGAFQDIDAHVRLTPGQALDRQLRYEARIGDRIGNLGFRFESVVIYDQMAGVDEAIDEQGRKVKRRGTMATAERAVEETLRSAFYYHSQRDRIDGKLVFAGQGITPDQYVDGCIRPMLSCVRPGDWFAFGGFCIIGRQRSLKPLFMETYRRALPILVDAGIERVHLLGICVADMVEYASREAGQYPVTVSTDSSSIEFNSVMGKVMEGGKWTNVWPKEAKNKEYFPAVLAVENIARFDAWARSL